MKLKNIRHSKVFRVIFCLITLLLIALFAASTIQGRTNTEDSFLRIASYVSAGLLGLLLFLSRMFSAPEQENDSPRSRKKTVFFVLRTIFLPLLFSIISVLIFVVRYLQENFQGVPWGQLLYHLHTPLEGTYQRAADHRHRDFCHILPDHAAFCFASSQKTERSSFRTGLECVCSRFTCSKPGKFLD